MACIMGAPSISDFWKGGWGGGQDRVRGCHLTAKYDYGGGGGGGGGGGLSPLSANSASGGEGGAYVPSNTDNKLLLQVPPPPPPPPPPLDAHVYDTFNFSFEGKNKLVCATRNVPSRQCRHSTTPTWDIYLVGLVG